MKTYNLTNRPPEEEMVYMMRKDLIKVFKATQPCFIEPLEGTGIKIKIPIGDYIAYPKKGPPFHLNETALNNYWVEI